MNHVGYKYINNEIGHNHISYTKINLTFIKHFNVRIDNVKLLELKKNKPGGGGACL